MGANGKMLGRGARRWATRTYAYWVKSTKTLKGRERRAWRKDWL
jgi:hypothetical protein